MSDKVHGRYDRLWVGELGGDAVQSSPEDAGAGKLLRVGAFGLGTSSVYAGDLNNINYAGFVFAGAASTNRPSGSDAGHVYTNRHSAGGHFSQVFIEYSTASMWVRTCVAGSWNAWVQIPNLSTEQTWTAAQTFNAFTQLGESSPAIKFKKVTGTTAGSEGAAATTAHGLTASKILSISVLVSSDIGRVAPGFTSIAGYQFDVRADGTNVNVQNHATNSENILSSPFTVLITYEE